MMVLRNEDATSQIGELLLSGSCCTEVLVRMGLLARGEENEQLAQAARGLCLGIHSGCNCGALSGGALLLSMFDAQMAKTDWIPELVRWFSDEYGMEYESIDCRDIAGEKLEHKSERCPSIIAGVYERCCQLLSGAGQL